MKGRNVLRKPSLEDKLHQRYETDYQLNHVMKQSKGGIIDIKNNKLIDGITSSLQSYNEMTKPIMSLYEERKEENDELNKHLTKIKAIKEYNMRKTMPLLQKQRRIHTETKVVETVKTKKKPHLNQKKKNKAHLSIDNTNRSNIFQFEPLLEDYKRRIDEHMVLYTNSIGKAYDYLKRLKKGINQSLNINKKKKKSKLISLNPIDSNITKPHVLSEGNCEDINNNINNDNCIADDNDNEHLNHKDKNQLIQDINSLKKMIKEEQLNSNIISDKKNRRGFGLYSVSNKNVSQLLMIHNTKSSNEDIRSLLRTNTPQHSHIPSSKFITYEEQIKHNSNSNQPIANPQSKLSKTNLQGTVTTTTANTEAIHSTKSSSTTFSFDFRANSNDINKETLMQLNKTKSLFKTKSKSSSIGNDGELPHLTNIELSRNPYHNTKMIYKQITSFQSKVKNRNICKHIETIYNDNHKLYTISDKIAVLHSKEKDIARLNKVLIQNCMSKEYYS